MGCVIQELTEGLTDVAVLGRDLGLDQVSCLLVIEVRETDGKLKPSGFVSGNCLQELADELSFSAADNHSAWRPLVFGRLGIAGLSLDDGGIFGEGTHECFGCLRLFAHCFIPSTPGDSLQSEDMDQLGGEFREIRLRCSKIPTTILIEGKVHRIPAVARCDARLDIQYRLSQGLNIFPRQRGGEVR
jgi:hypothetical protein